MNNTATLNRRSSTVRSLIFSLNPSVHSPPKKEIDKVGIYLREALRIIPEDNSSGSQALSEEARMFLIELQKFLEISMYEPQGEQNGDYGDWRKNR